MFQAITLDNNEIAFHNNLAAAYFQLKEYQEVSFSSKNKKFVFL